MPEVSIVIPVYNVEGKIRRCLDSISGQRFTDFEALLIDDGSVDASSGICDEYAAKDSRYIVLHQENSGVSTARNRGMELAQGEYLAFADSDDFVHYDYLKVMVEAIQVYSELAICGVHYCSEDGSVQASQPNHEDYSFIFTKECEERILNLLNDRRFNYVYAKLFRMNTIKKNNIHFISNVHLGEDTIFVMDYLSTIRSHMISIIGESYYYYIKYRGNTLTTQFSLDRYKEFSFINNRISETMALIAISANNWAMDTRRINAFIWFLDPLMKVKLFFPQKIRIISDALKDQNLMEALSRVDINERKELSAARTGNAAYLFMFCSLKEKWNRICIEFKKTVVRILPHEVIQKVKSWL